MEQQIHLISTKAPLLIRQEVIATNTANPEKEQAEWYLPAVGELALLWELHHTGVICNAKQECFKDFDQQSYWTSSEGNKNKAWYLNFFSGILMANSKGSTYNTRPVAMF